MNPDAPVIELAERFARAIVDRDFVRAHAALAPWLRRQVSPEALASELDAEIDAMREEFGEGEACRPETFELDWNSSSLESLREPLPDGSVRPIDDEVTAENFRSWMCLQLRPSEDGGWNVDAFFDLWIAVVEVDGEPAIGHYELLEPD